MRLQEVFDTYETFSEGYFNPPRSNKITQFIDDYSKTNFNELNQEDKMKLAKLLINFSHCYTGFNFEFCMEWGIKIYENIINDTNGYILK
jgi:hypothetical protein